MSHIDEGLLHAYLDGESAGAERAELEQHLAGCGECRARLEQARALRERSAAILSGSGPAGVTAPPFEDVLARARSAEARRRVFRINRLTALSWAATLVLAVGVGWIARGALEFGERTALPADAAVVDSAAVQVAAQPSEPAARSGGAAPLLGEAAGRPSEADQRRAQRRDEPTQVAKSELATGERIEDQRARRAQAERAEAEEERAKRAEADVQRQPVAGVATPATPAPAVAPERGGIAQADSAARAEAEPKAGAPAEITVTAHEQAAEEAFAARGQLDLDALLGGAGAAEPWHMVNEATAREVLGGALVRLPDAAVVAYLVPAERGRHTVRLVQRLASGEVVVLAQQLVAQQPVEGARDALRAMNETLVGDSLTTVSVRRGEYLLTLRGGLSADALEALLATLP